MRDADGGKRAQAIRALHFPGDDALGQLNRIGWVGSDDEGREGLGRAQGTVTVPAAARPRLDVDDLGPVDLFALDALEPDDLYAIALHSTMVDDEGLRHIGRLTGLRDLELVRTAVADAGLAHLEQLTELEWLNLEDTEVTDRGLAHLQHLTNLRRLELSWTKIQGWGLRSLQHLSKLEWLDLNHTEVTDLGLSYLQSLAALQILLLAYTRITDAGLEYLKLLTALDELGLNWTVVSDEALADLQRSLPGCTIYCQNRRVTPRDEPRDKYEEDAVPTVMLELPQRCLAAFLGCLMLGTLDARRTGAIPQDAGEELTLPHVWKPLRRKVPREILGVMAHCDELNVFEPEERGQVLDEWSEELRSELRKLLIRDFGFRWVEDRE